jgi:hypothetical protein
MADDDEKKAEPRQLPPQQPIDVTPRANEPVTPPPPPPPPSDDANR